MAEFVKVCSIADVVDGETKTFEVGKKKIMIAKDGGELYALSPYCTHDGEEIGNEKIHDHQVECPRHGARFNIRNGEVTQMPAVFGLSNYEILVKDDTIFIDMD
jgi:3-phenylpropionate/trans-cinnamate dioxygenase ferredoxin subunit